MKKISRALIFFMAVSPLAAEWLGLKISDGNEFAEIQPQYLNGNIEDLLEQDGVIEKMLVSGTFLIDMAKVGTNFNVNFTYFNNFRQAFLKEGDRAKMPILLSFVDEKGHEIAAWKLINCWPSEVVTPAGKNKGKVELSFSGANRIK
jgi:hypothetical protein